MLSLSKSLPMRVLILRDRASAGGGIYSYYEAIRPHLTVRHSFVGVGRPSSLYGRTRYSDRILGISTILRLIWDWIKLVIACLRAPDLVHVNPGLDIKTRRALRRDAVNVW